MCVLAGAGTGKSTISVAMLEKVGSIIDLKSNRSASLLHFTPPRLIKVLSYILLASLFVTFPPNSPGSI